LPFAHRPPGIEFAGELHDLCTTDITRVRRDPGPRSARADCLQHYPTLASLVSITV
jgi:hypothetical protein